MTTESNLTEDDLDVLTAALEAWEQKDFGTEIMADLIGAIASDKGDPVARLRYEAERDRERQKRERERVVRKERSILLRAKLLTIRNDRRVARLESATAADV